ncbi:MAG: diphosphomevalonate decarboxylase [bacterium]|nr:diphosphomevalonate decarboxylase [bacterium]
MKRTATAHANIALVKYWGKRDTRLNLPATGSISITLKDLFTRTTVEFSPRLEGDTLILNGSPSHHEKEKRVSRYLDIFRQCARVDLFARVESENNFPTGAGLASSASAFAALAAAADGALNLQSSPTKLSELARRGSGSAARSIFGGLVEMNPGQKNDGSDAVASQLYPPGYWPLEVIIFITTQFQKPVGSTQGMNLTAETSPYYNDWIRSNAHDLDAMRRAIDTKDFQQLGEISEANCLKMHGLAMSANPGIIYWNGLTVTLLHEIRSLRKRGIPAYFTIDAGPQVKVLCPSGNSGKIKDELRHIPGIKQVMVTTTGPGVTIEGE